MEVNAAIVAMHYAKRFDILLFRKVTNAHHNNIMAQLQAALTKKNYTLKLLPVFKEVQEYEFDKTTDRWLLQTRVQ